jgi:hypothetical protein
MVETSSSSDRWLSIRLGKGSCLDLGFFKIAYSGINKEFAVTDTLDPCFEHASSSFRNHADQDSGDKERVDFSHCRDGSG